MNGAEYRRHVFVTITPPKRETGERFCEVDQSVICVRYGGKVTFRAAKGCGPFTVFIPRPNRSPKAFPALRKPHFRVPARQGKTLHVLPEKYKTGEPREYPYEVYCHAHNCFAKGSLPRMMIGP